ncbi:MAG TPA: hypothetical protein VMM55_03480 [Thermohalobaculum sp.]|nr:hypothetical protein [Thermohalobaculum sp.]
MVARRSALEGHLGPGRRGLDVPEPGVRLSERRAGALWQVTAWPDRLGDAGAAAAAEAGVEAAPGPLRAAFGDGAVLMRTEPLRWLIVAEAEMAAPALDAEVGTLLDLGHARTILQIEGPEARALMARLAPLDFRPDAFPEGTVATSAVHHVAVTMLARGDGFDLLCFRSFGLALFEHVAEIAGQFGLEVA